MKTFIISEGPWDDESTPAHPFLVPSYRFARQPEMMGGGSGQNNAPVVLLAFLLL